MTHKFCDLHTASQQQLASLASPNLLPSNHLLLADLRHSQGPYLRLCDGRDIFDARQSAPPRVGYNASPLFGTVHYLENWFGTSSVTDEEASSLRQSFDQFRARKQLPPCDRNQSAAAINRDYIGSFICDQYSDQAELLHDAIRSQTDAIAEKFNSVIAGVRVNELTFALTPVDEDTRKRLLESRLKYGLLFDVEDREFQFTLHLGYRSQHTTLFWDQVQSWLGAMSANDISSSAAKVISNYEFHQLLLEQKLVDLSNSESSTNQENVTPADYLREELNRILPQNTFEVQTLTRDNYHEYRQQILDMQSEVYEPARQSPPEEFDALFDETKLRDESEEQVINRPPLAIVVLEQGKIISMAFSGPLDLFTCERGVTSDPHLGHPTTYYMLDLTVVEAYRGKLGRLMKNALTLLATQSGIQAIHGRNRERLARGMWAINLSLGSYELQHLHNDYPDQHQYRDCIYYRCPLRWNRSTNDSFSENDYSSLEPLEHRNQFFAENMPIIVNGHHERLTPTLEFIKELDFFASNWPTPLRHVLATCSPDETGNQIWKATQPHRNPNPPDNRPSAIVCLEGCSQVFPSECEIISIANPCHSGKIQYLEQLKAALKDDSNHCIAVVVEPITSATCDRISNELLKQTIKLCRDFHVPVVFMESGSLQYRYGEAFAASCNEDLIPDIVATRLGESMSVLLGQREFQPDDFFHGGESIDLFGFNEMTRLIRRDPEAYLETIAQFDRAVVASIEKVADRFHIENGMGWIEGEIPANLRSHLKQNEQGRFLVRPSYGQMKRLNEAFRSGL